MAEQENLSDLEVRWRKELKNAERALGEEPTDANLAWLRDVQRRLGLEPSRYS